MWAPENTEETAPVIERVEDPELLLARIIECLDQKDSRGLKTYILEHKFRAESFFWELILKIGDCVSADTYDKDAGFFDVCNRCLVYLVKVANPKEALLAVLEQMDTFIDDIKFKSFLPLLHIALSRIPSKLFHSLDIALEAVSAHLRGLPPPKNVQLEGREIKVFHMDAVVVRLVDVLQAYLNFLEPFVKVVDLKAENITKAAREEALVLKKHLVCVFHHPLCHLILTHDETSEKVKSDSRLCAEQAMSLFSFVETDFYRLIKNARLTEHKKSDSKGVSSDLNEEELDNQENEEKLLSKDSDSTKLADVVENWDFKMEISPLSQACLAYLLHVEFIGLDKFPAIFRHEHLLEFYLDDISVLLKNADYPINFKGLLLCQSLCSPLCKNSIPVDCLDNPGYLAIFNDLIHVMIKCPVRDHRQLATKIFPLLISKFQPKGRYQIYQNILSSCFHSGLKGFLITVLKNDIADNLRTEDTDKTLCFKGKRLQKLLQLAVVLPEGETSDMLENSDQIISSLNLLRFLVLADPAPSNATGFWDYMPDLEKSFINPLRRGLELSKAHYNLELGSVSQGTGAGVDEKKNPQVSVSVGGTDLPSMEKGEKLDLIHRALNTHDMMLSLLGRLTELVDQQRVGLKE